MIRILLTALFVFVLSAFASAQLISKFTWETSDPTQAAYGPNATSISSYAVVSAGGSTGNGLNAGAGSHDINMVLPGSYFTISSLDISIDFKRKEGVASFFQLGSFDFGMNNGALYIKYLLSENGSDVAVSNTNIYSIPSDNAFHTYRFVYNANTGVATVSVDGTQYYSYQAPASTSLSWTGAGNATVGVLMDGTGSNVAILDNLIIQNPLGMSTLPLKLLSFTASGNGSGNLLSWSTTREDAVRGFDIQRSTDGLQYETIGTVGAQQESNSVNSYTFKDETPATVNFYRLKINDINGQLTYSPIKKIGSATEVSITCFPNPVVDYANLHFGHVSAAQYEYSVFTVDGRLVQAGVFTISQEGQQLSLNLSNAPKGMLFIRLQSEEGVAQSFAVLRK